MFASKTTFLCLLPALCSGWHSFPKFAAYPPDASGMLVDESALASHAPSVLLLATLPGDAFFEKIEAVTLRNDPLFKLDVNYAIGDGLDQRCRAQTSGAKKNFFGRITDHVKRGGRHTRHCATHCTHGGRYCPIFPHDKLTTITPHRGQDLVMEVLRRTCLGHVLDKGFANPLWFKYLVSFQNRNCMGAGNNITTCSNGIFAENLPDFPSDSHSAYAECVAAEEADTDTPNPMLEHSLDISSSLKYDINQLPLLEIAGQKLGGQKWQELEGKRILQDWCKHFEGDTKPLSCEFCSGCKDTETCLWELKCEGRTFDTDTYKDLHPSELKRLEEEAEEVAEEVVVDTVKLIGVGVCIGFAVASLCWTLVELKRRRAVRQVAKELPGGGFTDSDEDWPDDLDEPKFEDEDEVETQFAIA